MPISRAVGEALVECLVGDIVNQPDLDVVVNAANAQLRPGGGVAGAIHRAAGPELDRACRPLAPIRPGQAVITDAFRLPNRWVIHCLGPVYGEDEPAEELLAACYRWALRLADEKSADSIAFPALSTGAFGYPMDEAAVVAMAAIRDTLTDCRSVRRVRFVLWDEEAHKAHRTAIEAVFPTSGS